MLFGENYIYQCPGCTNKIYRESLMSGNTFDAEYYSDGKRIAPMLPDFPQITKCDHCKTTFWIKEEENIGTFDFDSFLDPNVKWEKMQEVRFLTIPEYFEALGMKDKLLVDQERTIRMHIWWAFNDRIRNNRDKEDQLNIQALFQSDAERKLWKENAYCLEEMLDYKNYKDRMMIADLNRNAEKFDRCMEIILTIEEQGYPWMKDLFDVHCKEKNPFVFRFKFSEVEGSENN